MCSNINSDFNIREKKSNVNSFNCSNSAENHKKINFRQRIRSLRKECEDGPLLASTEDLPDSLDDSDFIVASRHKKGKKINASIQKHESDSNINTLDLSEKMSELDHIGISKNSLTEHFNPEQLLEFANNCFPNMRETELKEFLQSVREESNDSKHHLPSNKIFSKTELLKFELKNPKVTSTSVELKRPAAWCNLPRNITKRNLDFDECCICFQPWKEDKISLEECGHCFHLKCIQLWMKKKNTCPFCAGFSLLLNDFPKLT